MSNTLSFSFICTPSVSELENREFLSVQVVAHADGKPLYAGGRGDVFDAIEMLLLGANSDETDIFTCTCGVAGCAGIHDACLVTAQDGRISWTFPEEPFRQRLNPEVFSIGKPLKLTFERLHYEQALAELEAGLEHLHKESKLPTATAPCLDPSAQELGQTVAEFLAACRQRRAESQAWRQRVREAEGSLATLEAVAILADLTQLSCNLAMVAWELVGPCESPEARVQHLADTVRDAVLANPLDAVLKLSAQQLEALFHPDQWDSEAAEGWATREALQWSIRPVTPE